MKLGSLSQVQSFTFSAAVIYTEREKKSRGQLAENPAYLKFVPWLEPKNVSWYS
jgi:hypothetical protein